MKKTYEICVERTEGTTYFQKFEVENGNVQKALKDLKKRLGKGYFICGQAWEA